MKNNSSLLRLEKDYIIGKDMITEQGNIDHRSLKIRELFKNKTEIRKPNFAAFRKSSRILLTKL